MKSLDESSLTPLYQQVMEDLREKIDSRQFKTGQRIPSEPELSEAYGVSRITIRRAVEDLCTQGYLVKRQGKGTFVGQPKIQRMIVQTNDVQSFTEACAANGLEAGATVVHRGEEPATACAAEFFGVPEGTPTIVVERLRNAGDTPIMLEHNCFLKEGFEFLLSCDLADNSIFEVVREHCGRHPEHSSTWSIDITRAAPDVAELLDVPAGEPLFLECVEFEDGDGRPLVIGDQRIVGSRYTFRF